MVTVVKNPTGHKIIDQTVEAEVTDSGGDALVTYPYHGLGTGDTIYVVSDIEDYNGFQYVTVIDTNSFKLSEYATGAFVEYQQDLSIVYYQTTEHVWSSIFLPIVYKLSNDRWPTNSVDATSTVSSFSDDNGYTNLNLSGALKSSFNALEYVKISGASDESLNGVFQIVEVVTTSDITIDLPYSAGNSFSGATVQYYYNNYQVKVKVYGGLTSSHPWQAKKPYVEVAELSLTPDSDNLVTFSVTRYIEGKVAIKNNLLIGSYPLNLDAFTGFTISTGEAYDASDNYSLYTLESLFSADTFEGYAVAGKLPFKNTYSGDYSDYVYTSGSPALWMTNFSRLFGVEDLYFDISFIKSIRGEYWIIIDKYVSDYIAITEVIPYTDQGVGVYRIPIELSSVYTSFCVHAYTPGSPSTGGTPAATLAALSAWTNLTFGWTLGATPHHDINGSGGTTGWLIGTIATQSGYSYEFTTDVDIEVSGVSTPLSQVTWALLDSGGSVLDAVVFNYASAGVKTETFTLTPIGTGAYLAVMIVNNTPFDTKGYNIQTATYNAAAPVDDHIDAVILTEEICIDILQSCVDVESGDTPEDDFFRLLETGFFRLLEDGDRRLLEEAP